MDALHESELKLFIDSVRRYFQVITKQEPQITSAFLGTGDVDGHDYNGIVAFSGSYNGHVIVSMPPQLHGSSGIKARVRKHPYVITLRWNHQPALVCVDMEKRG